MSGHHTPRIYISLGARTRLGYTWEGSKNHASMEAKVNYEKDHNNVALMYHMQGALSGGKLPHLAIMF